MGYYNKDLYTNPESFGLQMVGEIDLDVPDYSFDILAVLYNPVRKNFYIISDSGCSCPAPFEAYISVAAAGRTYTAHEAVAAIRHEVQGRSRADDPSDLIAAIMRKG